MTRRRSDRQPHTELARARAHRERQHAGHADHGNQQRDAGEAGDHEGVQPLRRQHLRAHVLERRGALHGLVRRHLADDARHRRHERVRIACRVHEQPAGTPASAAPGDRSSSAGPGTTFSSSTSATMPTMRRGCGLPKSGSVHQNLRLSASPSGNSRSRDALADDHDQLAAAAVVVGEVAPGEHRHAERPRRIPARRSAVARADSPRHRRACSPRRRTGIRGRTMPASRQGTKLPSATPLHARQLADAPGHVFVEAISCASRMPSDGVGRSIASTCRRL